MGAPLGAAGAAGGSARTIASGTCMRAFLFDGAADLEGLPGAAEGGEGELVEDDVGGRDDPPDGGDVNEVLGAPRVVAEVDAFETSGGEVVRAERLGEDAEAVAEHHFEVLEGVVARVAAGDLDRRDPSWLSVGAPVRVGGEGIGYDGLGRSRRVDEEGSSDAAPQAAGGGSESEEAKGRGGRNTAKTQRRHIAPMSQPPPRCGSCRDPGQKSATVVIFQRRKALVVEGCHRPERRRRWS
mmetsp:Transcript_19689/g.58101  ORF Transcript_19689/g.58101 Transcript_19689/m.58101 type:complete len:240 (+) Transcript_19689:790-1509(+)